MIFKFKQFNVDQTGCAMKINTDGVLLGALTAGADASTILDIGTGTGVIALMLAQKFPDAQIDAVEIDAAAALTTRNNFANAPFSDHLKIYPLGFEQYFETFPDKKYDLMVSNPPFYINSLAASAPKLSLAKHAGKNFFEQLIKCIARQLNGGGACWLILPIQTSLLVKALATPYKLHIGKTISIHSFNNADPHRKIIMLGHHQTENYTERFVIYDSPKIYSRQYQDALKDFFTIF